MAVTAALSSVDLSRRRRVFQFILAFTGNYANSGTTGDLIDLTATTNPNNLERARLRKVPPLGHMYVRNHPLGYLIRLEPGTAMATGIGIRIFQQKDPAAAGGADIPLVELANGAYPAALLAETEARITVEETN